MVVGEKLKALRLLRGVTQKELAGEQITRNMLSQIERGAALPSYQTILYLSRKLDVDPGYFFEGGKELLYYELKRKMPEIRAFYHTGNYDICIRLAEPYMSFNDSEFLFILADCFYRLGLKNFSEYDLVYAEQCFDKSEEFSLRYGYPEYFSARIPFYRTLIEHYRSKQPLIPSAIVKSLRSPKDDYSDFLIYTFLLSLIDSNQADRATVIYNTIHIQNELYRTHFNAHLAASMNNYERAKELLWSVVEKHDGQSSPFIYRVYDDLERYCKASEDYEGAYRCLCEKQKIIAK